MALAYVEQAASFSGSAPLADLSMGDIEQMVFSLDMSMKYSSIRSRYLDEHNIEAARAELRAFLCKRFQSLVGSDWCWFDPTVGKFALAPSPLSREQSAIRDLFGLMFKLVDGSRGYMEGARLNFLTTNYDWLIEAVIDYACPVDDSVFLYLYRGVTPRRVCGTLNPVPAHNHSLVFNLLKINGGFEVFQDGNGYHFDYRKKTLKEYMDVPPILMLPSREQDYTAAYFTAVFPKAVRLLNESKALVLVGYSLPEEDALLRFLIRQFCEDEADAPAKTVFYVDYLSDADQESRLRSVFPFVGRTLRIVPHCGGFGDWAADVAALLSAEIP